MTPAQQLDIIRSVEAVEGMDEEGVSKRDLEVSGCTQFMPSI